MSESSTDWDTLAARIRGCTACSELASARTTVVVGSHPDLRATVMLVGEAPGANEDESGIPFVGRAGQLLDELLAEAEMPRNTVAVANVLKCRPPKNRKPSRSEVANCRSWLTAQLAIADPAIVVALGGTAVEWFFGAGAKIGVLRGRFHEIGGRQVLPTYHPSAAIRFGPLGMPRAALREDLVLAAVRSAQLAATKGVR
ncbi:MAG: uracil-DNA glycosylase [Acidothermaceae bacterium]